MLTFIADRFLINQEPLEILAEQYFEPNADNFILRSLLSRSSTKYR